MNMQPSDDGGVMEEVDLSLEGDSAADAIDVEAVTIQHPRWTRMVDRRNRIRGQTTAHAPDSCAK